MCVKRMRTDFSTLLMLVKGRPRRGAGVHNVREDTTIWTNPGRNLTRLDQLFRMADIRSGFLERRCMSYVASYPTNRTYCFVYKSVIRRCRRATPSASRVAALRNGWSPGTIARFGSFLFCSFGGEGIIGPRANQKKRRHSPLDLQRHASVPV